MCAREVYIRNFFLDIMEIDIPKNLYSLLAEETGLHIGDGSMNFYKNKIS